MAQAPVAGPRNWTRTDVAAEGFEKGATTSNTTPPANVSRMDARLNREPILGEWIGNPEAVKAAPHACNLYPEDGKGTLRPDVPRLSRADPLCLRSSAES